MNDTKKPVDRETLYHEIWAEPVMIVAGRYGLSDVGLAKICRNLAIPLPSRGYWAKVKAGRVMAKAPLPKIRQSGPVMTRLVKLPPEQAEIRIQATQSAAKARRETPSMPPPEEVTAPTHPLVREASKRLRQRDGWPEGTLARSAPKEVLNLCVTKAALNRALGIADALLKVVARQGFDCEVDAGQGKTFLVWLETGTRLEFALTEYIRRSRHEITPAEERARKRYWERSKWDHSAPFPHVPMYDYTPTGILTIEAGRWPSRSWKDTARNQLERRLPEITGGILALAHETHAREQEQARREEARRQAALRYQFLTERRENEARRFNELESQAEDWIRASRLRDFADAIERQALADGQIPPEKADWLAWARAKADWLDPLIAVSDPILDAPVPQEPRYW